VDLKNGTADSLPEGVILEEAVRTGGGWRLTFSGQSRSPDAAYQLFLSEYFDEAGNKYSFNGWSSYMGGYWDEESQTYTETPDRFYVELTLSDYPCDVVYLSPAFSRAVTLDTPVVLAVK